MDRSLVAFVLVTLFTVAVFAGAASSLDSAVIENGFGIEGGSAHNDSGGSLETSESNPGGSRGTGGGGFFDITFTVDNTTSGGATSVSPLLIVGIVVGITAGSIALIFWAGSTRSRAGSSMAVTPDAETEPPDDPPVVDPTNEVYRAWWEMVRQLNVTQYQSRSPAELASLAVEEGRDPETVAELTSLFRSVRYGGVSVTDDVEQRAVATRDRLHSASADEVGVES